MAPTQTAKSPLHGVSTAVNDEVNDEVAISSCYLLVAAFASCDVDDVDGTRQPKRSDGGSRCMPSLIS